MELIKRLLTLMTGGVGGASGAVVGVAQWLAVLGAFGAAWLWVWDNKDAIFIVVRVGDLAFLAGALAFVVVVLWLAGRAKPGA